MLALEVLLPDLIKRDIAATADMALELESWASREQVLLRIADAWAGTDAQAAFDWSHRLPQSEERKNCRAAICRKLALSDPARAVALSESFPDEGQGPLLASLTSLWMARDSAAATAWISAQKSPDLRDLCWQVGVSELAKKSPEQAANLAVDHIASETLQAEAVISVLHQWILRDRKAAAEWVDLFPAGPLRTRAEGELKGTH